MSDIKIYKNIELSNPVMIAGWPGMGNVALGAVDYMRRKLKAVRFAEIKVDPMLTLDSVDVENGLAKLPKTPANTFYYAKNPDLIIFEGEVQLAGSTGIEQLGRILDLVSGMKVKRIFTGAAFPAPMSYKDRSELYGVVNKESLKALLDKYNIKPMEGGHISGLNGLALGFAAKRNIEAICILSTMPQYAVSLPNPKASASIIEVISHMLGMEIDFREITGYVKDMEERMAVIEEKVKDVFTIEEDSAEPRVQPHLQEKKIPGYIMEKIEKLFLEAKHDRNTAGNLKKELDRWDLYKMYEDRFLDLFKDNQ